MILLHKKKARRGLPLLYWLGGLIVNHGCVLTMSAGRVLVCKNNVALEVASIFDEE